MSEEITKGRRLKTVDTTKSADETITKSELEAIQAQALKATDLEKSLETAQSTIAEFDTLKAKLGGVDIEDLLKAAQELKDVKKAQEEKVLADTIDVVKGFNLFDEDKVEDVAKFFVKNAGEPANLILTSLEKARVAIKEFGEAEHGSDHEGITTDTTKADEQVKELGAAVLDIIKSRKSS